MPRFNIYLDKKAETLHEGLAIREDRYKFLTKRIKQIVNDSKTTDLLHILNEGARSCFNARELVFMTIGVCRNTNKYYFERKPNKYLEQLLENLNKPIEDKPQFKTILRWSMIAILVVEATLLMLLGQVNTSLLIAVIAILLIL